MFWLLASACVEDPQTRPDPGAEDSETPDDSGLSTEESPPVELDCTVSAEVTGFHSIQVFEDFDFLADGRLVTGANDALMATTDWDPNAEPFGFGLGANPTGVRVLSSGLIAVAEVDGGNVFLVDPSTGGVSPLLSGLSNPNGLAAAHDGTFYVSEHIDGGRLLHVDPDAGDVVVVFTSASTDAPNGLALSADDAFLYVAVGSRIDRVDLSDGSVEILHDFGSGEHDSVAVDVCGAAYTIDYTGGVLHRISLEGVVDDLATITDHPYRTGLRWGIGTVDLPRDHLYLSARTQGVTEIATGVDGVPPVF